MASQTAKPEEIATRWAYDQRLRLVFVWLRDRFQLQLFREDRRNADAEQRSTRVLTSHEGTAADRWPASPPLQSLAIESRGENRVALAVGMAGKAHWSASVETLEKAGALRFDYACRLTEEPEFLGSTFEVVADAQALETRLTIEDVVGGDVVRRTDEWKIVSQAPLAANSIWTARWHFTLQLSET